MADNNIIDKNMMASGVLAETSSQTCDSSVLDFGNIKITVMPDMTLNNQISTNNYSTLKHDTYYSNTCEKERGMNIQLPYNYTADKKYPVLYVLHGIFGDEYSMCGDGKSGIPALLDNMMSTGDTKEMIVVYPFMFASKDKEQCTGFDESNTFPYDNFVNELVNDIMPYMAKTYSILKDKKNTAIIGFSMGGRESIAIGIKRPDLFGYVGAIAPAPGLIEASDKFMSHAGQFKADEIKYTNEEPYIFMVCAGDSDGIVGTFPKSYHELFIKNDVNHIWWEIPGSDHGDPAISSGIYNFARYIYS